ncbi:MAG: hypothetical protein DRP64_02160 [Verrucomicrobia bacterium]|nr:MAG: hypothetical protein DRP64_02160 [Verrucomicrobiota bacterium]
MRKRKTTTLYDLAQHVGYAKSTVSYVMNGKGSEMGVAQKTIGKIKTAAKELGYVPNYWASSLARRPPGIVSVLLHGLSGDWGDHVVSSLSRVLKKKSYTPFLAVDWDDPELFEQEMSTILQRQDAGVFCHSFVGTVEQYARITDSGIPLVFLGDIPEGFERVPGAGSVAWDDGRAARRAVEHLAGIGRKKIAFVGVDHGLLSDRHRYAAYEQVVAEAGQPIKEEWKVFLKRESFSYTSIRENMIRLSALGEEAPDAIFAMNDAIGMNVLLALKELGIRVPDDIAVIGMGDLPLCQFAELSTVKEPLEQLGETAALMMLERIECPSKEAQHRKICSNELAIRQSTGG